MAEDLQALLARNQLGLSLAVDLSQALKSYDTDVRASVEAAVGGGGGPSKENKPASTIGAPRQLPDDLPSMGALFTCMDVPVFLANDDITPYAFGSTRDKRDVVCAQGRWAAYSITNGDDARLLLNDLTKPPTYKVDFVAIACGLEHTIALAADGRLWGWGSNEFEQLAVPNPKATRDIRKQPEAIHFPQTKNPFVFVAAGHQHSLAIAQDAGRKDLLWSWGQNANGQCGHGKKSPAAQPHAVNLDGVHYVSAGENFTMALTRDGRLWAFGCGANGLLGTGSAIDVCEPEWVGRPSNAPLHGKFVDMVACGRMHTLCVCQKEVYAWGANDKGQLGLGSSFDSPVPKIVTALSGSQVDGIACGFAHTVVLSQRRVYSFGLGSSGQLGHSNLKSHSVPKLIDSIGADFRTRLVIASDYGDLQIFGNLRSKGKISTPKLTCVPIRFTGLDRVFALAAGAHEVSAIRILPSYPAIKPVPDFLKNSTARSDVKDSLAQQLRSRKMARAHVFGSYDNGRLGDAAAAAAAAAAADNDGHDDRDGYACVTMPLSPHVIVSRSGIPRSSSAPAAKVPIIVTALSEVPLVKVSCGKNFTVVLDVNGRIWSWGGNKFGQLGLGHKQEGTIRLPERTVNTEAPCQLEFSRDVGEARMKHIANKFFTDIRCGGYHTIALTSKAKVYAWGKNKYGQLGIDSLENSYVPTLISKLQLLNVNVISAGYHHSICITGDGDAYTWGNGWSGTLGHRDERIRTTPEMVVITDHGSDTFRFSKCAAGFGHTVLYAFNAQQKMYTLFTFGLNDCGQLGLGDVVNRNWPCSVVIRDQKLTDGVVVSCGYRHTVVQCEASQSEVGAIFCFGSNQHQLFGSLFSESYYTHPMPVLPPYHSPTSNLATKFVVAGKCCNVYVSADNRMSIVGYIAGPGKTDEDNEPASGLFSVLLQNVHPQAKDINIKGLSVGDEHCIVLCEDNDYERVVPGLMQKLKEAESARTKTTGASGGDNGVPDDESDASSLQSFLMEVPMSDPQAEDTSQFEGAIVTWGSNDDFQMGTMGYSFPFAAEQASQYLVHKSEQMFMKQEWGSVGCSPCLLNHRGWGMRDVVMVACGTKHTVAVCGRGDVWLWGNNEYGQLGLGDFIERKIPVRDSSHFCKKSMVACAAGTNHTLLLSDVGKVFSFGDNREGQLGLGWVGMTHPDSGQAITCVPDIVHEIKSGRVGQICAGRGHSLALSEYGFMWAWGCNADGQLGCGQIAGAPKNFPIPKDVDFSKCAPPGARVQIKAIASGFDHCLALTHPINNAGQCIPVSWGLNASGQLGHGDFVSRDLPKVISTFAGRDILSVYAGADTSGAIDRVGQLYLWGGNDSYNLGSGDQVRSSLPVRCVSEAFPPEGVKQISLAKHHTMLLSRKNRVYCWGLNDAGQLGQPTMNRSQLLGPKVYVKHPMKVGFLSRITTIACGRKHSVAVVPMPPITGFLKDFDMFLTLKRYMNAILQRMPDEVLAFELGKMRRDAFVSKLKVTVEKELVGASAEDDINLKKLKYMDIPLLILLFRYWRYEKHLENLATGIVADIPESQSSFKDDSDPYLDIIEESGLAKGVALQVTTKGVLAGFQHAFVRNASATPFVSRLGLGVYAEIFTHNEVSMETLMTLTEQDFIEMGIESLGARRMLAIAQDELRNSKFAEFETDAPDNIWHPEYKQEQLDKAKKELQAAIDASAPPEQLLAPMHYPEVLAATSSLQSIPEYQLPQPIYDHVQHQQQDFSFQSQLEQPAGMLAHQDNGFSRQSFQSMDYAQPQDQSVIGYPSTDHPLGHPPALEFPAAGKIMIQRQYDLPPAGTKAPPTRQDQQGSDSRVLAPLQPS